MERKKEAYISISLKNVEEIDSIIRKGIALDASYSERINYFISIRRLFDNLLERSMSYYGLSEEEVLSAPERIKKICNKVQAELLDKKTIKPSGLINAIKHFFA